MSTVTIEIQTNEQSKKLKWMPIATFSGGDENQRACEWGEKLIAGFHGKSDKPMIRLVDRDGQWLGDWGGDCR